MFTPLVAQAPTDVLWWSLFRYYLFLGFGAGAIVTVVMLYWILRYRVRGDIEKAPKYSHEDESGWGNWRGVVMTLLLTGALLGFVEYQTFASDSLVNPPTGDPIYVNVHAQQFAWSFGYANGYTSIGELIVPANQVVVLNITSSDVDHAFDIISLSVAKDAIPGEHNFLWFNATQVGSYPFDIRCKELCGVGHADMVANFTVMSENDYNTWYSGHSQSGATTTTSVSGNGQTMTVALPQGAGGTQKLNFSPSTLSVTSGTTIQFVDQDTSAPHNVYFLTVPNGATNPNGSGNPPVLNKGNTYSVTLTKPGTYTFECQFHSGWMQGTITVTG